MHPVPYNAGSMLAGHGNLLIRAQRHGPKGIWADILPNDEGLGIRPNLVGVQVGKLSWWIFYVAMRD